MLSGETKMFPLGFPWLRVRSSSKAKAVFEPLMAAMPERFPVKDEGRKTTCISGKVEK